MPELDDGLQNLQNFIGALGETRGEVETAATRLESIRELFESAENSLEEFGNSHAEDASHLLEETLGSLRAGLAEQLTGFDDWATEWSDTTLAGRLEEIGTADGEHGAELDEKQADLEARFAELTSEAFDTLRASAEQIAGEIEELDGKSQQLFEELGGAVGELRDKLEDLQDQTVSAFEDIFENIQEALTEAITSAFDTFREDVAGRAAEALGTGVEQLSEQMTQIHDHLREEVERIGTLLTDAASDVFSSVMEHITTDAIERIVDAVESLVREFLETLIADLVESLVLMNVGASTTAALSPFLPQLVVAKNVVETINDLLDALNPFD